MEFDIQNEIFWPKSKISIVFTGAAKIGNDTKDQRRREKYDHLPDFHWL
jgi:hypothetical protein